MALPIAKLARLATHDVMFVFNLELGEALTWFFTEL